MKTRSCPVCPKKMRYETRDDVVQYKGVTKAIRQSGWWCGGCGEAIFEGNELAAREKVFLELKARVDGVLVPDEVAAIRKRLNLSQRRAGEILGGGPRAFQKYESGETSVSLPMSNLLRFLDHEPRRIEELKPAAFGYKQRRAS